MLQFQVEITDNATREKARVTYESESFDQLLKDLKTDYPKPRYTVHGWLYMKRVKS